MLSLAESLILALFTIVDVLPNFPNPVIDVVDSMFQILLNGISLASFFIDFNMVKILIPIVIAVINLDKIVKLIVFIVRKIPMLGIK